MIPAAEYRGIRFFQLLIGSSANMAMMKPGIAISAEY
jgi:hypothetical protein